jgi:hypothetical protein
MSKDFREILVDAWYGVHNLVGEDLAMHSPSGNHWQVRIIGKVYWGWPCMGFVGECK